MTRQHDMFSRRRFLRMAGGAGLAAAGTSLSGTLLTSCSSSDDLLKVGVIAPFSGPGAPMGSVVNTSLGAAVKHLNASGGVEGRKVEVLLRDAGAEPASGARLYRELVDQREVVGVLWCGALGLDQVLSQMRENELPVVIVFDDPFSRGVLGGPSSPLFQMEVPSAFVTEALATYAATDRGYTSAALLHDASLDPDGNIEREFEEAFGGAGLEVLSTETFATDDTDYEAQLQRLQVAAPQVLFLDGLPVNAAAIVTALAAMGASYVDTPTTKGLPWHPHIFGSTRALGDSSWADLAGEAAKVGTVTGGRIGGLIYQPSFSIAAWMQEFLGEQPTGGEEQPADALATVLEGVKRAGTSDRRQVVLAIEATRPMAFASTAFAYAPDRHVAVTPDDVVIRTLERLRGPAPTDPPYELGAEWSRGGLFDGTATAASQLVRPTLQSNREIHPEVMAEVLEQGFGTQCTKRPDGTLSAACKIH